MPGRATRFVEAVAFGAIRAYQLLVSPWLGVHCRHVPSCSGYAREAVVRHGPWRGGTLALKRLLRCHPWGTAGYDPVPEAEEADSRRPAVEP